jgi:hypothetical protein
MQPQSRLSHIDEKVASFIAQSKAPASRTNDFNSRRTDAVGWKVNACGLPEGTWL